MTEIDAYNGVRTFAKLLVQLCRFYNRHTAAINAVLGPDGVAAMVSLDALCAVVLLFNEPGPN